jgi:hypothetical protein
LEANQEKIEAVAEYCEGVPCIKAAHLLTALQGGLPVSYMESQKDRHLRRKDGHSQNIAAA